MENKTHCQQHLIIIFMDYNNTLPTTFDKNIQGKLFQSFLCSKKYVLTQHHVSMWLSKYRKA
jgi:hypothetical protein